MKSLIKKLIPKFLFPLYHRIMAVIAMLWYRNPSKDLIVIGVTGTNGKSTTTALIAQTLEVGGYVVGATSTVSFKIGEKEWLNDKKMTMLGRFQLQKLLRQMVTAGCRYAIVETSSQGIEQSRHIGINYDYVVFTNLTPEHIEAHGGFENYKKAKGKLFAWLTEKPHKKIDGQEIKKIAVVNNDDAYADYFLSFDADSQLTYSVHKGNSTVVGHDVRVTCNGTQFRVEETTINLKLVGAFNVWNALPAVAIAKNEGLPLAEIKKGLESVTGVPGRMELIDEGQDFTVLVDYAPEPASMEKLYETVPLIGKNKVIHVLGSCGGGRDVARRPVLGRMAGEFADYVIVTNEDPYDDDPMEIIDQVATGALEKGKVLDENLFKILDRKEAINKALSLAHPGDLVLITGKGSEQAMAVAGGKYVPWDDRKVVRECLNK